MSYRSTIEQLVLSPIYIPNPPQANERVRPFVQDLNLVIKGTTYLLTLKRIEASYPPDLTFEMGSFIRSALLSCPQLCRSKDNFV